MLRRVNAALAAANDQGGNAVALTPASEMVMKTSYSEASQLARLKGLAELGKKEAPGSLSGGWITGDDRAVWVTNSAHDQRVAD